MSDSFVTVAEAAALLGVSPATLRNWDKQGKVSARRHPVNKYRMYARHEIDELAAQTNLFPAKPPKKEPSAPDARSIRRLIAHLHSVLRDNDAQSTIVQRFDELTKLIFTKAMSDRAALNGGSPLARARGDAGAIKDYYARLAREHSTLIPPEFASLQCSDAAARQCIDALEMVNFSDAGFDVPGLAYEEVIRNTFDKSDNQQFFTPPQVVEFVVSMAEPDLKGAVCDPACGTGGFLAAVARRDLPYTSLTGMEIDARLRWAAGVNVFLHDGRNLESLLLPKGGTLGEAAKPHFGRFDAILTNPPFGSDLSAPELLGQMRLGRGRQSRRRGILFIERCWELLRPGGLLAIIIDEGVLNLSHADDVRSYVLQHFDIGAVVSLPESAFQPYASVNASILLMRKRARGAA